MTRSRCILPKSLAVLLSLGLLGLSPASALGDFPCDGDPNAQSCADWSKDPDAQGSISATAECVPDPMNPSVSYCGYASAKCTQATDCDYGSCGSDGFCKGYIGDPCPNGNRDCQGFFFCGTDGVCGGSGADCANGDPTTPIPNPESQCGVQKCNLSTKKCEPIPAEGLSNNLACGNDDICSSGNCEDNVCRAAVPAASRGAQDSRKAKRYVLNGSGPNVKTCPHGLTACAVGDNVADGFECIDSRVNLEQCGGCLSDGGQDCTAIHGVEGVQCQYGRCIVLSCAPGLVVSPDESACVL